jgi:TldD protein
MAEEQLRQILIELVGELEQRFPYAAALYTSSSGTRGGVDNREQSLSPVEPSRGVVFTVYEGEHFAEFATSELDRDRLAADVRAWMAQVSAPHNGAVAAIPAPALTQSRRFQTSLRSDPQTIPAREKLEHFRSVQQRAAALDPRIVTTQVRYSDSRSESDYIRNGRVLSQQLTRTLLTVFVVASDGQRTQYAWKTHTGTGGFEVAHMSDTELRAIGDTALQLLTAGSIMPGEYDVVTDNSVSGVIAHECFGHGVELDLFPKGRARAATYLHQRVAAPGVNMFDDPTVPGAFGSYFFDDEGQIAAPTQILRDGILERPISDMVSALLTGSPRTGNGRRESFARKAYARMSNTFFVPGDQSSEEILACLEDGIYLRMASSGMEDPMGWGIQVTAHYGEEIKHGRRTGRIFSPIGMTGFVPQLLQSITAIGNDLILDGATCGKGHKEMVVVSTGGPHLRMRARLG